MNKNMILFYVLSIKDSVCEIIDSHISEYEFNFEILCHISEDL
jgi:hypothetical protein